MSTSMQHNTRTVSSPLSGTMLISAWFDGRAVAHD